MLPRLTFLVNILFFSLVFAEENSCSYIYGAENNSSDSNFGHIELEADKSTITNHNTYAFEGNAVLNSSDLRIESNVINFNKLDNSLVAKDNNFYLKNLGYRGSSVELQREKEILSFRNLLITSCPDFSNDWGLNAKHLTLSKSDSIAKVKDMTLNFFGVPIFYSPYLEWVMKGRGTGFLAPKIKQYTDSTNKERYQVSIPYYFNLAKDRDLLLTARNLSGRGTSLDSSYRQLLYFDKLYSGVFSLNTGLLEDKLTDRRWMIDTDMDFNFDNNNLSFRFNRVSDKNYNRDISLEGFNGQRLISNIKYNKNFKDLDINIYSEDEQLINSGSHDYTKNLDFLINKKSNLFDKGELYLSLNHTNFENKDFSKTTGNRTHTDISFQKKFDLENLNSNLNLGLMNTNYNLDNGQNQNRILKYLNSKIDSTFEREFIQDNKKIIQTLSPVIFLNFISKEDQSELPNFDSALKSNNYYNLFDTKKYTGIDRISNDNSVSVGLESDFIDAETGETFISLRLGQNYRFNNSEMNITGTQVNTTQSSDFYAFFELNKSTFSISQDLSLNSDNLSPKSSISTMRYSDINNYFDVKFINDNSETIEIGGMSKISNNLNLAFKTNQSIDSSTTNSKSIGLVYDSCCWRSNIFLSKKLNDINDYDKEISFDLILKGFSSSPNHSKRNSDTPTSNYLRFLDEF